MSITDTDRGMSYLLRRAAQMANGAKVEVGVPEDAGNYPNGTPVVVVAAAHEFGLGTAPQRSFIRGWYDGKGERSFKTSLAGTAQAALMHGVDFGQGLKNLGATYVAEVHARMDAGIAPELADATVAKKQRSGSSTPTTPLEDTHRLRAAVTARVKVR